MSSAMALELVHLFRPQRDFHRTPPAPEVLQQLRAGNCGSSLSQPCPEFTYTAVASSPRNQDLYGDVDRTLLLISLMKSSMSPFS
jgi:hypothetical protein